jgi:Tfp pilus assembly protein PilE
MGQQQLLLIILGVIIVGIAVAVGITMFKTNAVAANRDALVNDLTNMAARAQQYYRRPTSLGGGNQKFDGFTLTAKEAYNANMSSATTWSASGDVCTFVATGTEKGSSGSYITVTMQVGPDNIDTVTFTD